MFSIHQVSKSFDLTPLFENVTFSLNPGERVGLIGPNGCGKTTLLRILVGEERPDAGHVQRPADIHLGYLRQGFELDPLATLGQVIGQATGNAAALETELSAVAQALTERSTEPGLQQRYDSLLNRIAWSEGGQAATILNHLGLDGVDPSLPCRALSGGQKTRLMLALVLLGQPDLLLLDEPTNHLDIAMLEWLEGWLADFPGAVLIVSHDRTFLDRTVTRILEIDPLLHRLKEYSGNYSAYLDEKLADQNRQWAAYRDQQEEIRRVHMDIVRIKEQARWTERQASSVRIGGAIMKQKGAKDYHRAMAKKTAAKARVREKKLERYLDSQDRVERPQKSWHMRLEFSDPQHQSKVAVRLEELSVGYPGIPPLLVGLHLELNAGQRVVLTGPNGCGKTTLLRTIIGELAPLAGQVWLGASIRLGVMTQEQTDLDPALSALATLQHWFPTETEARSFLAYYLITGDEPLKPNAMLSYGQRARLALARLVAQGCTCLLLDEPINHLDIPSRTQFEQALANFPGAVLAVVHDRYFIERFAERVWRVEGQQVKVEYRELPGF